MLSKITLLIVVGVISWLVVTGKLSWSNSTPLKESFSQFVEQNGADKYVIAELKTNETFTATKLSNVVKDTITTISLVAHYNYYIRQAELTYRIEDGIVFIDAPRLYLLTPVAFDFDSVRETCDGFLGLGCEEIFVRLKQDISTDLINKGRSHMISNYGTAAKSLADNLNGHFTKNGYGRYYKSIVVSFATESSNSQRQFNYNDSYCDKKPCLLDINLDKIRE
ncbi:MAG: hypothetical protein Q8N30_08630 [Methylococcales bacterium]|nr:hypothetical protein [Methylococcales bacterium]